MILARDLSRLYSARVRGVSPHLPPTGRQPADHTRRQNTLLDGPARQRHEDYWREQLRDAAFPRLPDNRTVGGTRTEAERGVVMAHRWFDLSPRLLGRLAGAARSERTTLPTVLTAAALTALCELTGQDDLAMGTIDANRADPRVRQTVGFLADMVLLRAAAGGRPGSRKFLHAVDASMRGARAHQELPFLSVPLDTMRGAGGPGRADRPQDAVFHLLPTPPDAGFDNIHFAGLHAEPLRLPGGLGSRFDLQLLLVPTPHGLDAVVRYTPDRFTPAYAERLADLYLAAAGRFADQPVAELRR
jgi:hypothetical protein